MSDINKEYIVGKFVTLVAYWKNNQIIYTNLQWKTTNNQKKESSPAHRCCKQYLLQYEQKNPLSRISLPLDWSIIPQNSFQKNVLSILSKLPYGKTITYGALAKQAGNPLAARAVGAIMKKNPWSLIIPCHRVIAANGNLTGFTGSGGLDMKTWLLRHEGHSISQKNSIYMLNT